MLKDFIAQVKTSGLSRTNRYKVTMSPPLAISSDSLQSILLYCDQVQLPGMTYSTTQNRSYGEFREVPYERLYDNCQLSFYVDTSLNAKLFFDQWLSSIQSSSSRNFNYYNNYVTDITVEVQDLQDKSRYTVVMYECFPKTVSSIQLDYAAKDVMKLSVNMQYKYWKSSAVTQLASDEVIPSESLVNSGNPIFVPTQFISAT